MNATDKSDSEKRAELARYYIIEIIKNTHSALKLCWTIIFATGTFASLSILHDILRYKGLLLSQKGPHLLAEFKYDESIILYVMAIVAYYMTFARFYMGSIRVFDIRYFEIFALNAKEVELGIKGSNDRFKKLIEYSDNKYFLKYEFAIILTQTLFILFLATSIGYTNDFLRIYAALLILNSFWLFVWEVCGHHEVEEIELQILPGWRPVHANGAKSQINNVQAKSVMKAASFKWLLNNISFAALIIIALLLEQDSTHVDVLNSLPSQGYPPLGDTDGLWNLWGLLNGGIIAPTSSETWNFFGLSACFLNCILDFYLTNNFYLPKFWKKYEGVATATVTD